jgi:hypothetical protein
MANPIFGGLDKSYWKDENTYVGYYACIPNSRFPCPQESQFPGWKKISEKGVNGSYGQCSTCAVTEIIWGRIDIAPGTPTPTSPKKTVKLSYSIGSLNSSGGWSIDNAPYSQYGTIDQAYAEKTYGGTSEIALRNWLVTTGITYGYFSINDTIYDKNGNLVTEIPPAPTSPPVVTTCVEGTTRTVICPNNGKLITQKCTGNAWITIKADETKCLSDNEFSKNLIATLIIVIIIFYLITRK